MGLQGTIDGAQRPASRAAFALLAAACKAARCGKRQRRRATQSPGDRQRLNLEQNGFRSRTGRPDPGLLRVALCAARRAVDNAIRSSDLAQAAPGFAWLSGGPVHGEPACERPLRRDAGATHRSARRRAPARLPERCAIKKPPTAVQ